MRFEHSKKRNWKFVHRNWQHRVRVIRASWHCTYTPKKNYECWALTPVICILMCSVIIQLFFHICCTIAGSVYCECAECDCKKQQTYLCTSPAIDYLGQSYNIVSTNAHTLFFLLLFITCSSTDRHQWQCARVQHEKKSTAEVFQCSIKFFSQSQLDTCSMSESERRYDLLSHWCGRENVQLCTCYYTMYTRHAKMYKWEYSCQLWHASIRIRSGELELNSYKHQQSVLISL